VLSDIEAKAILQLCYERFNDVGLDLYGVINRANKQLALLDLEIRSARLAGSGGGHMEYHGLANQVSWLTTQHYCANVLHCYCYCYQMSVITPHDFALLCVSVSGQAYCIQRGFAQYCVAEGKHHAKALGSTTAMLTLIASINACCCCAADC
jgi:hypothetical protein